MIKKLKLYEESLVIRTRKITKFKPKSEEEIKKEINLRKNNSDDMILRNEKDMENENKQIEKKSEVKLKPKKK